MDLIVEGIFDANERDYYVEQALRHIIDELDKDSIKYEIEVC